VAPLTISMRCQANANTRGRLVASIRTSEEMWTELDSHADMTCAGANCIVLESTQQVVDVTPYNKSRYEPETNIPIVKAATAYTDNTGNTYIFILNQALYLPDLDHSLLNPNQMRMNGVIVDDCPQHLSDPKRPSTHSIFFPELSIRIPLELGGVISRIRTRCPTNEELEHCLSCTLQAIWNGILTLHPSLRMSRAWSKQMMRITEIRGFAN
jgi:hypothetical protein